MQILEFPPVVKATLLFKVCGFFQGKQCFRDQTHNDETMSEIEQIHHCHRRNDQ